MAAPQCHSHTFLADCASRHIDSGLHMHATSAHDLLTPIAGALMQAAQMLNESQDHRRYALLDSG